MTTYPFDLKRALAGDAVCDENETKYTDVTRLPRLANGFGLMAFSEDGDLETFRLDGGYANRGHCSKDLRMVTDGGPTVEQELVEALKRCVSHVASVGAGADPETVAFARAALAKAGAK